MNAFDYFAPDSLPEVFDLLGRYGDEAKLIAGGTALVILMRQNLVRPSAVVSLRRLKELGGIDAEDGGLRIGALATHREVEVSPLVRERAGVLSETLRHVATIRIRNVGTLGGNLAHADPNQDPPATLIALGASVELASRQGRREVPVDEFFTDYYETALQPGEVVTAIRVPGLPTRAAAAFSKFLPRSADDYATVSVAAVVSLDESGQRCQDVRIGLGSAGSTPIRARQAEDALRGQELTDQNLRQAAAVAKTEVDPISDIRGSAEYKRDMAEVWVRRTLERALGRR
jgi:carbon-monoxide dehydrogenase medium subunit